MKEKTHAHLALRPPIERFKQLTLGDKLTLVVAIVVFFLLIFVYEPTPTLIADTRLVQQELIKMGHSDVAEIVILEPTS